jgi:hypothetical protein
MGLRQRAKEAWDERQRDILQGKIRATRKLLRESFGVKDEEMDTFETAAIGLCGANKTIRVEDLLFMVNDEGALCVRDQRVTQHVGEPWKEIDNLADLGALTAVQNGAPQTPRI